jgi:gas vesicle protein
MSDTEHRIMRISHHEEDGGHPLAIGFLAGAAVGEGLGLLLAPKKGSDVRHELADRAKHVGSMGHDAYCRCRDTVSHGAQRTGRYMRDVAGTMKRKMGRTSPVEIVEAPTGRSAEAGFGPLSSTDIGPATEMHITQIPAARGSA